MLKRSYPIATFSSVFILCLSPFYAKAQEYSGCFIINSAGDLNSLDTLCKHNEQQDLRTVMNAQEFYRKGLDRGRKGLYKEAIADYNQAINNNSDFAEAYVSRATVRYLIEDEQGGVEDLQKALNIYKARGDLERHNIVLGMLQHIQREAQMDEQP